MMSSKIDNVYPFKVWIATLILGSTALWVRSLILSGNDYELLGISYWTNLLETLYWILFTVLIAVAFSSPAFLAYFNFYRFLYSRTGSTLKMRLSLFGVTTFLILLTFTLMMWDDIFRWHNYSGFDITAYYIIGNLVSTFTFRVIVYNEETEGRTH